MKILPKHVFSIHTHVYKGIETPTNYVDGICINSDGTLNLPIGTKCIYSRNTKNKRYTHVFLPFPIHYEGVVYGGQSKVVSDHLSMIGESDLLYKHKMIYVDDKMKASDINIDKIISDASIGITTTIVIDVNNYSIHFLNRLLKLPYNYASIPYSICGKRPEDYFIYSTRKSQIGITILNLNDCKPSFSNNYNGIGIKIKLYQSAYGKLISIDRLFACLYSDSRTDLYFMDGLKTEGPRKAVNTELERANSFIKTQRKIINQNNKQKNKDKKKYIDEIAAMGTGSPMPPMGSPVSPAEETPKTKSKEDLFDEQIVTYTNSDNSSKHTYGKGNPFDQAYVTGTVSS